MVDLDLVEADLHIIPVAQNLLHHQQLSQAIHTTVTTHTCQMVVPTQLCILITDH